MSSSPITSISKPFLRTLLQTGKYSDLTIKCGSETFHVHKSIICTQSKVLAAMIDGNFMESTTSVINLEDDNPKIVNRLIQFLYTADYDDSNTSPDLPPISPRNPTERSIASLRPPINLLYIDEDTKSSSAQVIITIKGLPEGLTLHDFHQWIRRFIKDVESCQVVCHRPLAIQLVTTLKTGRQIIDYLLKTTCAEFNTTAVCNAYTAPETESTILPESLEVNTMIYIIGDKYDIPAVKLHAVKKAHKSLAIHWKSDYFFSSLKLLYENTVASDHALKQVFVQLAGSKRYHFINSPKFQTMLSENGDIGLEFYKQGTKRTLYFPQGDKAELFCNMHDCIEKGSCFQCGTPYFYHIDEVEEGNQKDFVCGNIQCQFVYAKRDLYLCNIHSPKYGKNIDGYQVTQDPTLADNTGAFYPLPLPW